MLFIVSFQKDRRQTECYDVWILPSAELRVPGTGVDTGFPGDPMLHPGIHFTPIVVSLEGGWHDIAGAITHNGVHHIYQGTGWNHAHSTDLVHWQTGAHGPAAINETYAGMSSFNDPCSGYITKDPLDNNRVCAGFRQCGSAKGVAGMANWDVPLELRSTSPDYMFNVSWWRPIPYDPARPWKDTDGNWRCLALRGKTAKWEHVGAVFTSNATVLGDTDGTGHLTKEFVTIDFLGTMKGDPDTSNGGTKIFLNNVGGNGGGEGCCSGTTSYFPLTQTAPGQPFVQAGPQGMVDWGSFLLDKTKTGNVGIAMLTGTGSRGLSMARTLGTEEADQVTKPGRRVLIGWTGGAEHWGGHGSAQSLPRDLSLAPDRSLLQAFVPELEQLRVKKMEITASASAPVAVGLQAEVLATFPSTCGSKGSKCTVSLLGDSATSMTTITLWADKGLVLVDGTSQGNSAVRAGPLPPANAAGGWTVHAIADHAILELIVNNATAFVVYVYPTTSAGNVAVTGQGAAAKVWALKTANNM
eukprot:gene13435-8674_t